MPAKLKSMIFQSSSSLPKQDNRGSATCAKMGKQSKSQAAFANLNKLVKVLTLKKFRNALLEICWTRLQKVVVVEGESFTLGVVEPTGATVVADYCYQGHTKLREKGGLFLDWVDL